MADDIIVDRRTLEDIRSASNELITLVANNFPESNTPTQFPVGSVERRRANALAKIRDDLNHLVIGEINYALQNAGPALPVIPVIPVIPATLPLFRRNKTRKNRATRRNK
jgi:hypothetical protein